MPRINDFVDVPDAELVLTASRSGGPGGQNVNKVSTKMSLEFDVAHSPSLTDEQRAKVMERLAARITNDGVLRLTSQKYRTQLGNREEVVRKFVDLMQSAFVERKARRKTRVPRVAKEKRIQEKKVRSDIKKTRSAKY